MGTYTISQGQKVSTLQKQGLMFDLDAVMARVTKALDGDMKFTTVDFRKVSSAQKKLGEVAQLLEAGLLPSNAE